MTKAESTLDDLQHDVGVFAFCGLNLDRDDSESLRSDDSAELLETLEQARDQRNLERSDLREAQTKRDEYRNLLIEAFPLIKDMTIAMKFDDALGTHVTMGGSLPRIEDKA